MDKPKKGNTITIKLNGEGQPFTEDKPKKDLEPTVVQPPKEEIDSLEPIESEVVSETAAAQEPLEESFDWIIPESSDTEEIEEFKIVSTKNSNKSGPKKLSFPSTISKNKPSKPIGSSVITVFFAILIGTTIGFFMLKLVSTDQPDKIAAIPTMSQTDNSDDNGSSKSSDGTATAVVNQVDSFVVQGGVFSSKEGSNEIVSSLSSKGVPAQTIEMDGKYYLFLGVSDSIESAKSIGNQYKENGVDEVFAKSFQLQEKEVKDVTEKEKSFLEAVPVIYQTLSSVTASSMVTKGISQESSKALAGMEEKLDVSGIKNEKVKNIQEELTSANEKIKAYQKDNKSTNLVDAQQHLLNFLSVYYSL